MNSRIAFAIACAALGGCTSVQVNPVAADEPIKHICIQYDQQVEVGDLVAVMQEGFQTHGITSQVFTGKAPAQCVYTATYTASRAWDMGTYMTDAQIDILRDGHPIASADYHLKGGGGLDPDKWRTTRTKILPVIDTLLAQTWPSHHVVAANPDLARRLSELKVAYDSQLITEQEYEAKRKELISQL